MNSAQLVEVLNARPFWSAWSTLTELHDVEQRLPGPPVFVHVWRKTLRPVPK
jgi:hypothetical protein